MKNEYDSFVDDPSTLSDGEVDIAIRELTPENRKKKYRTRYVRAKISKNPENMPDGDILRLRWQRGRLHPEIWAI
ncbi:MAG: hypothetical protein Q7J12_03650, partial [Syntrophales bacterium]|nr:hypothetical protein [Syntrophales bacterium]